MQRIGRVSLCWMMWFVAVIELQFVRPFLLIIPDLQPVKVLHSLIRQLVSMPRLTTAFVMHRATHLLRGSLACW
jgi:hypothetical protein